MVLKTHRSRNHRQENYNITEQVILDECRNKVNVGEDVVLWRKKVDIFQPKFNYKATWLQLRVEEPIKVWWKGLWFSYTTPKYAFHAWIAVYDRLATGDRMLRWNVGATSNCVFCPETTETRNYLYFECQYSEEIWRSLVRNMLGTKYTNAWEFLLELLVDDTQYRSVQFLTRYAFQTTLHIIWRERNNIRHGEAHLTTSHLIKVIDKQVRNRLLTMREMGDRSFKDGMEVWFASR